MKRKTIILEAIIIVLVISLFTAKTGMAAPYYKGKIIQIFVPHAPGGGTDIWSRLVARHLPQYIPGHPKIIIRYMLAGMTIVCGNYIHNVAPKDGLSIMAGSGASAMHSLIRTKGTKFSYENMPVLAITPMGEVCYTRTELCPIRQDFLKVSDKLIFGCAPMPWSVTVSFELAKDLFGFKTKKDILAYQSAEARRAFLAGEIDIGVESSVGFAKALSSYVKKGEVLPLWQSGVYNTAGRLERQGGALSEIPTVKEFYENLFKKAPSGEAWAALSAYIAYDRGINKSLFLPPGTEKYAQILRPAVVKMVNDPKFIKEKDKILLGSPVYAAEEAEKMMKLAGQQAASSKKWLKNWLKTGWNVDTE